MNRRSTERLLADAEQRLRLTADLPSRIDAIRGTAADDTHAITVTTTVHGALTDLSITADALTLGPDRLGAEIVRLAAEANRAALVHGVDALSRTLGDAGTVELAGAIGLIEPVVELEAEPVAPSQQDDGDDDYAMNFDFSSLRSDR